MELGTFNSPRAKEDEKLESIVSASRRFKDICAIKNIVALY
jgi:hypothetical protein